MQLIKALYQFMERTLFNSLLRKLLGCMVPIFGMLVVISGYLLHLVRTLRPGLLARTGAGAAASLELLARAETLAIAIPILAPGNQFII